MTKIKRKSKFKIHHEHEGHIIEYDIRTMIFRSLVLVFFISFLIYVVIGISSYTSSDDVYSESLELIESSFNDSSSSDLIVVDNDYDSNLKGLKINSEKSYGDFYSLDDNVLVQGKLFVTLDKGRQYASISSFKITKNKNLQPALSKTASGESIIFLADSLLGTVGDQNYEIPKNLNLDVHRYFILFDKKIQKPVAYSVLK